MAKKNMGGRKANETTGVEETDNLGERETAGDTGNAISAASDSPPSQPKKVKESPAAEGSFAIGEIRKAAAFANSVGGLDKAIALLQILKVAKEVQ